MGTEQKNPNISTIHEESIVLPCDTIELSGNLVVPEGSSGIVLFAHGSGSSRHSPRNRFVAERLHQSNLGTLLFDLLTVDEEREEMMTGHLRFDIPLLARRLITVTEWIRSNPATSHLAIGYFGSSTGAAAALSAGAARPSSIGAIVSRGGRPDLSIEALRRVTAPTLLIVGEKDSPVLDANREALAELRCKSALEVVPRATHLFEEPGALEYVSDLAAEWFANHLEANQRRPPQTG